MSPLSAVTAVGAVKVVGAQRKAADPSAPSADTDAAATAADTRLSDTARLLQALDRLPDQGATPGKAVGTAALPLPTSDGTPGAANHPALRPLLPAPPVPASIGTTALAQGLQQALASSGLFYEAHLLEWVTGARDQSAIAQEPQAQLPALHPSALPASVIGSGPTSASQTGSTNGIDSSATNGIQSRATNHTAVDANIVHPLAVPLVHQQLQAIDTQVVHWNVQAWPGQMVQLSAHPLLQINESIRSTLPEHAPSDHTDEDRRSASEARSLASAGWTSTLRLQLPHLGEVRAEIHWSASGCRVQLLTHAGSASTLRQGLPALGQALGEAGLRPESLRVNTEAGGHALDIVQ